MIETFCLVEISDTMVPRLFVHLALLIFSLLAKSLFFRHLLALHGQDHFHMSFRHACVVFPLTAAEQHHVGVSLAPQ